MTNDDALLLSGLLTSLVLPVVISWLKQDTWPKLYRFILSIVVSALAGILVAYGNGELDFSARPVLIVIAIITATQLQWRLYFKDTGLEEVINPPQPSE